MSMEFQGGQSGERDVDLGDDGLIWRSQDARVRLRVLREMSSELGLLNRAEGIDLVKVLESLMLFQLSPVSYRLALVSWIRLQAVAPGSGHLSLERHADLADRLASLRLSLTNLHDVELREIARHARRKEGYAPGHGSPMDEALATVAEAAIAR